MALPDFTSNERHAASLSRESTECRFCGRVPENSRGGDKDSVLKLPVQGLSPHEAVRRCCGPDLRWQADQAVLQSERRQPRVATHLRKASTGEKSTKLKNEN